MSLVFDNAVKLGLMLANPAKYIKQRKTSGYHVMRRPFETAI